MVPILGLVKGSKVGIGDRLKKERERLGYTQTDFAALVGASKKSQIRWEHDESYPDAAALAAFAEAGANVMWIITGQESGSSPPPIAPSVRTLIDNYEAADEAGKRVIEGAADLAARSARLMKQKVGAA